MSTESKYLLIQFRTDASAAHECSCLERHGGLKETQIDARNVFTDTIGDPAEELKGVTGLIVGGSGQFVLSSPEPIEDALGNVLPLLDYAIQEDFPLLGACFGHQMIGWRLGATLVHDDKHAETGSFPIELTDAGVTDPIFASMPRTFYGQLGHKDTLTSAPTNGVILATSERNPVQAFRVGRHIYGVQFHPELDLTDLMFRLQLYPEYMKGRSIDEMKAELVDSPHAPQVFRNFMRIAEQARMTKHE